MQVVRCISCDGYGWAEDDFTGEVIDCDWCKGIGYVYRVDDGVERPIPPEDWERLTPTLERLEQERLREMGYQGEARKPWDQDIRRGTRGGQNPYASEDDAS